MLLKTSISKRSCQFSIIKAQDYYGDDNIKKEKE